MAVKVVNNQIILGVLFCFLLWIFYLFGIFFIEFTMINFLSMDIHYNQHLVYLYVRAFYRVAMSMLAIALLGVIAKNKHAWRIMKPTNYRKTLLVMLPFIFLFMLGVLHIWNIDFSEPFSRPNIHFIPAFILFELGTGIFEEVVFRGILLGTLLYQWGYSTKGRVCAVLISSILFGAVHFPDGADYIANAFVYGIVFAAMYMITKNIFTCVICHALLNLVNRLVFQFISGYAHWEMLNNVIFHARIILEVGMMFFAIIFIFKSKPPFFLGFNRQLSDEA